jgi:hypothetical protein
LMRLPSPAGVAGARGLPYWDVQVPSGARTYLYTPSSAASHSVASSWKVMLAQPPSTTPDTRSVPGSTAGSDHPVDCDGPVWLM